ELTNNRFYQFSGGEKAMAMYIPLFTACYSRYKEADPSAPYIISLDEAFAGVDDENISTMFNIVEQLDFDYIMNSQILWGDYPTVSNLSIYELIRPKNANFVSLIPYHWDGKVRQQVEVEVNFLEEKIQYAIQYFQGEKAYDRLFELFRKKYESSRSISGNIATTDLHEKTLLGVAEFFGITIEQLKQKGNISLQNLDAQIQQPRFEGIYLKSVLDA